MIKKSTGDRIFDVFNIIFLGLFAFICLYPFVNILAMSFNSGLDTMKGGVTIWPRDFTLANYKTVFQNPLILGSYKVTILRTVIGTLTSLVITAMGAYALSEKFLPGKKIIMTYILITMFFSGGLIPSYLTYKAVGLLDTFWVYIIPGMFSAWNCIIMKTSFSGIPVALKESVRLDGGNEFTILRHIILPLSMPMFAALALFCAVGHWNEWFSGMYYVRQQELIPVQTYLMQILNSNVFNQADKLQMAAQSVAGDGALSGDTGMAKLTSMSIKMAIVVIGTAPILILYPFLQKYFVKGVMIGSVKE